MILDQLQHHHVYHPLGTRIVAGFEWLQRFSPETADGRYEIDGRELFALVQSYETTAATEKRFESHRNYIDIQYIVHGCEVIYYAPLMALKEATPYQADSDYTLYHDGADQTPLQLGPGMFALFYPQDGHKPGCVSEVIGRIKKVVLKIQI